MAIDTLIRPPQGAGNLAGLVMLPAVAGVNDYLQRRARTFSEHGFIVGIVDYYVARTGAPDVSTPEKIGAAVASLSAEEALEGVRRSIAALRSETDGRIGVLGYCIGGAFAMISGCELVDVSAVVNYYGTVGHASTVFSRKGSPLERIAAMRSPMLAHYGAADRVVAADEVLALERAATDSNRTFEIFRYGGAPHAFDEDFRASYRPVAAKEAFDRTLRHLHWYLRADRINT